MKKISHKITLSIAICSIVISTLMCGISIYKSKSILLKESNEKMRFLAQTQSTDIDRTVISIENGVKNLAFNTQSILNNTNIDNIKGNDTFLEQLQKSLVVITKIAADNGHGNMDAFVYLNPELSSKNKAYQSVLVKNNSGIFEDAGEVTPAEGLNPNDPAFDWYYQPKKQGKGVWGEPYEDQFLKKKLVTYSVPIYLNKEFIGVAGMDIEFSVFEEIINKVKLYDTGYAALLNKDANFIIHKTLVSKSVDDLEHDGKNSLKEDIIKNENGTENIFFNGEKKIMAFSKISNGYIFCVTAPEKEIFKSIDEMIYLLIGIIVVGIVIAIVAGSILGRLLVKPIKKLATVMKKVESGDLTCTAEKTSNDEIGTLTEIFNNMILGQKDMINKVLDSSNGTINIVKELSEVSSRITMSSAEVTESSQAIASRSNVQAEDVISINNELEVFNSEMNLIFDRIQGVNTETQNIDTMAKDSDAKLKYLVDSIVKVYNFFEEARENVLGLNNSIISVSNITGFINEIAEQTNLLALNASIEAARAGEAGRGFAIVAQEIGKLAEQTKESSTTINTLLQNVNKGVSEVVYKTESVNNQLKEQQNIIMVSSDSFKKITSAVDGILPKIKNILESAKLVDKKKNEILLRNKSLSASTQEISSATEEVAALTEELNRVSNNVAEITTILKDNSTGLNEQVKKFKV